VIGYNDFELGQVLVFLMPGFRAFSEPFTCLLQHCPQHQVLADWLR